MDVSAVAKPGMPTLRAQLARFRPAEMACALVVLVAALTFLAAPPGSTATGTAGPVNVSVTPSVGLADGQTVAIHAEATGGAELFEIRAHVCRSGAISNFVDFGYQGPYCVAQGGIAQGGLNGDYETFVAPESRVAGDLEFRAGTGSVGWLDELGEPHTLTCGPGSPCALVVQLQITNATVYYTTGLCFGGGCPAEPGTEPSAAPVAAAEPPPASTPDPAAAPAAAAPADAAAASAAPQSGAATAAPKAASGEGSATSSPRTQALGAGAQTAALTVDPNDIPNSIRVFAAEAAGIAGGVLIVLIVMRARRRMALESAGMPRAGGMH